MYVHLSVAAPQELMSFLPFFLVDIRTAQTLRLERYITPVYIPQTTGNWGIDKEIILPTTFCTLDSREPVWMELKNPFTQPAHFTHLNHIFSGRRKCVAHFLVFPWRRTLCWSLCAPSRFSIRQTRSRAASPSSSALALSLCLCSCSQDPCALLSHHHEFGY